MLEYLFKRLATIVPTLVFVSMLIFGLQQLLPGDPAMILAGEDQDPAVIAHLRAKLHLDEPLPVRYAYWIGGVLQGDLGESVRIAAAGARPHRAEAAGDDRAGAAGDGDRAADRHPGRHRRRRSGATRPGTTAPTVFALSGLSTPNFWLGILMILLFSVQLGWLPASGYVSPFEDLRANLAAMIMPAFVLGTGIAAVLMRHTRSAMLQVLSADYVRTARAKGLSERVVVLRARAAQRADAGHHAGRAGARHAAVGRGADRAGVHHPRLRQADRRRRLQPRLCGGAGRGAGHGHCLHRAEPAGRPGLFPVNPRLRH